jgi:DNA helicase II / ATP-dependent DNA helicase PcrA
MNHPTVLTLSDQQSAIVNAVDANNADVQVVALAGCGKTTTIVEACKKARGRVAFFAFNKSIATELQKRAPAHVNVQTLHSLGFACIRNSFRGVQVNADKTHAIITKLLRNDDEKELISPTKRLVGLVKNNLADVDDATLYSLCSTYDVHVNGDAPRVFEMVRQAMDMSVPERGATGIEIDFDDMIFLPAYLGLPTPQYDWTFVDEAQDMNAAQHEIIMSVSSRGRLCYVGDPYQAIYAFRGADDASMNTMASRLQAAGRTVVTLPLTMTRRCPKSVVALAQQYVPQFEAFDDAPEGVVRTAKTVEPVVGDMVLCRANAPLVPVAYSLLRQGIPAKIQGRFIGQGLLTVIKKLKPTSVENLVLKAEAYRTRETATLSTRFSSKPSKLEDALAALNDKVDTLVELAAGQPTVDAVIENINRLFEDVNSASEVVLLSTVHKAKGLEAPRVWILETKTRPGGQENNIRYVAITRAMKELVLVPVSKKN